MTWRNTLIIITLMCGLAACEATSEKNSEATADIMVGDLSVSCAEDPACVNRIHPDTPMIAEADPGDRIVFFGRDAFDLTLDPAEYSSAKMIPRDGAGVVHALTGPVHIKGAKAGDVIAITIESLKPAKVGWTEAGAFGFAADQFGTDGRFIVWRLNDDYAESDALPGVRIPNASFPGVITTLPDQALHADILERETDLLAAGGTVFPPDPEEAKPAAICGADGTETN